MAVATRAGATVRTVRFGGDRPLVRQQAVIAALDLVRQTLAADGAA
jgi:nicotinamide mononucleotide (NMN) deamidase PncC